MTTCFIIGPIGDKFAPIGSPERERYEAALEVFEKVIVLACAEHDLEPVRADQIAVSGEITDQVFRHLFEDPVVIADVSGGNPNVMYELGLRHTRDLLTIQIGEYSQLPFDLQAVRTLQFSRSEQGLIDARKALSNVLAIGLEEGGDPVTATRIWQSRQSQVGELDQPSQIPPETINALDSEVDDVDADGLLERMNTVEEVFPRLGGTVEEIGTVLTDLGVRADQMAREMTLLNSSGQGAAARLVAAKRFADILQGPADELARLTSAFSRDMDEIDGGVNGILEHLHQNPDARQQDDAQEFLAVLVNMVRTARQSMEDVGQFVHIVQGLGSASKSLRRPGNMMAQSLRQMAKSVALMDEWEAASLRLQRDSKNVDSNSSAIEDISSNPPA